MVLFDWGYLYRAVDSHGDTLDFMLSERRDEEAATAFFKQAINNNGFPDKVVTVPFESYVLLQFLQSLLERSETL
jgi:transposase-like protein